MENSSWTQGRKNPHENSWTMARLPRDVVITLPLEILKTQLDKLTLLWGAGWARWHPEDLFNLNGSVSICYLETVLTCQFKIWVGKPRLSDVTSGIYLLSGKGACGTVALWAAGWWVSDAVQIPPSDKLAADGVGDLTFLRVQPSLFLKKGRLNSSNIRKY